MIQPKPFHTYKTLIAVEYYKGLAVAVGIDGYIMTTRDNVHWKKRKNPAGTGILYDVFTNGKIWMACGVNGILRSSDGEKWEHVFSTACYGIKTNGKSFVAVNNAGTAYVSDDNGETWVSYSMSQSGLYAFDYLNDRFVVASASYTLISLDGKIWTQSYNSFSWSTYLQNSVYNNFGRGPILWNKARQRYMFFSYYASTHSGNAGVTIYHTGVYEFDGAIHTSEHLGTYNASYGGQAFYTRNFQVGKCHQLKDGSWLAFQTAGFGFIYLKDDMLRYGFLQDRFTENYVLDFYETDEGDIITVGVGATQRYTFKKKCDDDYTHANNFQLCPVNVDNFHYPILSEAQNDDGSVIVRCVAGISTYVMTSKNGGKSWEKASVATLRSDVIWVSKLGLFISGGQGTAAQQILTSPDGITWTSRASGFTASRTCKNIQWFPEANGGEGLLAATNNYDEIITSPDGITWTKRKAASSGYHIFKIVRTKWFDNPVAEEATLEELPLEGEEGIDKCYHVITGDKYYRWDSSLNEMNGGYQEITEVIKYLCAIGNANVFWSKDLLTWTAKTVPTNFIDMDINDEGVIVAATSTSGTVYSLEDRYGWTWTARSLNRAMGANVVFDPVKKNFIVGGYNNSYATKYFCFSKNGINWRDITQPTFPYTDGSRYGYTMLIRIRNGKILWYMGGSTDYNVYSNNANVVHSNDYGVKSGELLPFTFRPTDITGKHEYFTNSLPDDDPQKNIDYGDATDRAISNTLRSLYYNNGRYFAVTQNGVWVSDDDGYSWVNKTSNAYYYALVFKDNLVFALGGRTSPYRYFGKSLDNGNTWEESNATSGTSAKFIWKAASNGTVICSIAHRDVSQTKVYIAPFTPEADVNSWTEITVPAILRHIIYDGNEFVAVGNNGYIITSPNGIDWTERTSGVIVQLNSIKKYGNRYFAVGAEGTLLVSEDKITWDTRNAQYAEDIEDITKIGNTVVLITADIDHLYISEDMGESWEKQELYGEQLPPSLQFVCERPFETSTIAGNYQTDYSLTPFYEIPNRPQAPATYTVPSAIETIKLNINWSSAVQGTNAIREYELQRKFDEGIWETIYIGSAPYFQDTVPQYANVQKMRYRVRALTFDLNEEGSNWTVTEEIPIIKVDQYLPLGDDENIGSFKMTKPSFTYAIQLETIQAGVIQEINEYIDNTLIRSYVPQAEDNTVTVTDGEWIKVLNGQHTFRIEAIGENGVSNHQTIMFTKDVDKIIFHLNVPLTAVLKPTAIKVNVNKTAPQNSVFLVQACNNGFDSEPTWEDITEYVKNGTVAPLENEEKESIDWGIDVKVTLDRASAQGNCNIGSLNGNFG
jgi:photosystem II stability/assembly factor-like uncharacterized protein